MIFVITSLLNQAEYKEKLAGGWNIAKRSCD
jgi:hypothetical protein